MSRRSDVAAAVLAFAVVALIIASGIALVAVRWGMS